MAQIQGGTTYADGGQVTATNLNAHVNNAVLVPGAISDQPAVVSTTSSDTVMVLQSGALKKATLSQLPYINKDGNVAMTAELTLSSSTPVNPLSAASKGYVDTGLATKQATIGYTPVNKAGDTDVGPIALAADPVSALQVATKQYVDGKQLGYTPVNKAGDTMTGALTLPADPSSALQASTKQYVDNQIATRVAIGGGTLGGNYLFTGKLQTSTAATESNDVINKAYFDAFIDSIPQFAASAYFYTNSDTAASTVNTSTFLTVLASRSAGSSTLTVNYSSLAARYYDANAPFFLREQYVGINTGTTGVTGRLYKIESANLSARTFTVTTPETTAFNGSIQLTLVYDSTNLAINQYGFNVKSIYLDMTAVSKYYVNYIADIISGLKDSLAPALIKQVRCVQLSGNGIGYIYNSLNALPMRDVGRTTYIYNPNVEEGFGSTSLGCHIGYFYNGNNGSDYTALYGASFLITAQLPPA